MQRNWLGLAAIFSLVLGIETMAAPTAEEEAAYTRTITERADKIVAPLGIQDAANWKLPRLDVPIGGRLRLRVRARDVMLAKSAPTRS